VKRRALPLEYAIRNLARRRLRTVLTALSSALVGALLVATISFMRGLEGAFAEAAQEDTAILLSSVAERDVVRSTVSAGLAELVAASVPGVKSIHGVPAVSAEIHMGTTIRLGAQAASPEELRYAGFVRGVTDRAFLVHERVTLVEGRPPRSGEVIIGRLVAHELGVDPEALAVGRSIRFENATFTIVGRFAAPGTTVESEIWTPLAELRGLTKRDDSSAVFVRLDDEAAFSQLDLFAKRRLDLELVMIPSAVYYRELADYFGPIRAVAALLAALILAASAFGGANTLNAAVQDRIREIATLRALGYSPWAVVASLAQESFWIAAGGGVVGLLLARVVLRGAAMRIAMSAFELQIDGTTIALSFGGLLVLASLALAPAAVRALRLPIAAALKEN